MLQIKFKHLDRSEFIQEEIENRLQAVVEKFPYLQMSRLVTTVTMENSPHQSGPDLFTIKLQIKAGRYDGIIVEKSDANVYLAIADLAEHMLEVLNRFGDKQRVKSLGKIRKLNKNLNEKANLNHDDMYETIE